MTLPCGQKVIYDFSGNQQERGILSVMPQFQSELHAFTQKQLETERAAQELLGAPTIGRGSARPRGDGGGSQRSQINLPSHPECTKKAGFQNTFCPKNHQNAVFYLKVLTKYTSETFFEECINFNFCVTQTLWSYTCSKFQKSYTPPAAQISVRSRYLCNQFFK